MAETFTDHYERLGVSRDAVPEEIKLAFRRRMRHAHTDVAGSSSHELAAALNAAQETLLDAERRKAYDRTLRSSDDPAEHVAEPSADEPEDWGTAQEWDSTRERSGPSWGVEDAWDVVNDGTIRMDWRDEDDAATKQRFRRWSHAVWIAWGVALMPLGSSVLIPIIAGSQNAIASSIGNGIIVAAVVGVSCWLILRRSFPVVGVVIAGLSLAPFVLAGYLAVMLLLAPYVLAITLGIIRRRRTRYVVQLDRARIWEDLHNQCTRGGRHLRWILQAVPTFQGRKTNALVETPATGRTENIWIWGEYRAGLWIDYLTGNQTVAAWATDSCREAWNVLDQRGHRKRQRVSR